MDWYIINNCHWSRKKISKDNVKYGQNVENGELCNYLFFLSKDSSGSDVETNKTYSEIEGIGEARDIILEYETFNKYQNATGDVAYKPGVLVRNTASGNGWKVFADGYVPGKLQVAKEKVSSYSTGYGADDKNGAQKETRYAIVSQLTRSVLA